MQGIIKVKVDFPWVLSSLDFLGLIIFQAYKTNKLFIP